MMNQRTVSEVITDMINNLSDKEFEKFKQQSLLLIKKSKSDKYKKMIQYKLEIMEKSRQIKKDNEIK